MLLNEYPELALYLSDKDHNKVTTLLKQLKPIEVVETLDTIMLKGILEKLPRGKKELPIVMKGETFFFFAWQDGKEIKACLLVGDFCGNNNS